MLIAVYKERGEKFQKACHRMPSGWKLVLSVVGLLVFTVCAQASPTTNMSDNGFLNHSNYSMTQQSTKYPRLITAELVGIGIEPVRLHIASAISNSSKANAVEFLPAVPTAVLMVLIGFLCVSLVRDRRVWLAVLSTILWIGHVGIRTVPQLANHPSPRTHAGKYFATEAANFYQAGRVSILTQCKDHFKRSELLTTSSVFLTILPTCRLVPITEIFVCFKSTFLSKTLSRGPPQSA